MTVPDSPIFWSLAPIFVVLHVLAIARRRLYWPFRDWPMFSTPPSLPRCEAFRIRLCIGNERAWWRPHYYYRARNYSHVAQIMLGRVRAGELPFPQVAPQLVRNAVALVRSDCPGVDFAQVRRIEIVKMVATLDGDRFAIEEQLVLGVDAPAQRVELR